MHMHMHIHIMQIHIMQIHIMHIMRMQPCEPVGWLVLWAALLRMPAYRGGEHPAQVLVRH